VTDTQVPLFGDEPVPEPKREQRQFNWPSDKVFDSPPWPSPPSRRDGPDTSEAAAKHMKPAAGGYRRRVEAFVKERGADGAIPDDAIAAWGMEARQTSIRPRFTELAKPEFGSVLVATDRRRLNRNNCMEIVYVHCSHRRQGEE